MNPIFKFFFGWILRYLYRRRKMKHYKTSIENVYKKLWDMEFLKEKFKTTRESSRLEHDRMKETIDALLVREEKELKSDKRDPKVLDAIKVKKKQLYTDIEQVKQQMNALDSQIQATGGLDEKMEAQRTVITLLREHMKNL